MKERKHKTFIFNRKKREAEERAKQSELLLNILLIITAIFASIGGGAVILLVFFTFSKNSTTGITICYTILGLSFLMVGIIYFIIKAYSKKLKKETFNLKNNIKKDDRRHE